jgi:excinuclease ABC subunit B
MPKFKLVSDYTARGDQPSAIRKLQRLIKSGSREQILLGVTGSGKTFSMACLIAASQRPALIISHNKTLAGQLYSEFSEYFPENAVEYFVSYYDYYQPEAYIASSDTYIEKEATRNDELDRLRLSTTRSLLERRDVIVVASVSCIYGIGSPEEYKNMHLALRQGDSMSRELLLSGLVEMQYQRNDVDFHRGTVRVRGDVIDIFPGYGETALRVLLEDEKIAEIIELDPLHGEVIKKHRIMPVYPAQHYVMPREKMRGALGAIRGELKGRLKELKANKKLVEAQRLEQRTNYDLEMLAELNYCQGVENYSRHFEQRQAGEPPFTLLDYLAKDSLVFVDESHVTVPQLRGMYKGDRSRKKCLIEHGFRLPSALDNRPLYFEESIKQLAPVVFVSATPGKYELERCQGKVAEQVIRPTGLMDPRVEVRPVEGQVKDFLAEVKAVAKTGDRTLVTTLTKRLAEDLADYLHEQKVRVRYLHSDIETLERMRILRDLRLGKFDCLVGINLLREGLDLPEVALVAIFDADKEGFLRSDRALIQTMGRAARHLKGRVILYADKMTDSMKRAIGETERRRKKQAKYNKKHGITPTGIKKAIRGLIGTVCEGDYYAPPLAEAGPGYESRDLGELLQHMETEMKNASKKLQFEKAAELRDKLRELKQTALFLGEKK